MRLVVTVDGEQKTFRLREGSWTVGRSKTCELVIPTKAISRQHAQLYVDGNQVTIKDLGSSNGIYVNGNRAKVAVLNDGDVIGLGRNLQMKFETSGDAAGDDFAGGASDLLVDGLEEVETHNERAGEAGQEFVEEGEYVEDEPAGSDDTPVDEEFAPVKYEPQPAEVGPQLVERDGKWFLKDPDTGREVEIVPKWAQGQGAEGAAADEALEPVEAEKKRRLRLIIMAAAVVLIGIILVGMILQPPPDTGQPIYTKEQYNEALNKGIDHLGKGEYQEATLLFRNAHKRMEKRYVAGLLTDVAVMLREAEEELGSPLDWERLERLLKELRESVYSTPKVEMYVDQRTAWADAEQQYEAILARAIRNIKTDPEAAFGDLEKIKESSRSYGKAQEATKEARNACVAKYVIVAKKAEERRQWEKANAAYREANSFSGDDSQFSGDVIRCTQNMLDLNKVMAAKQALDEGRLDAVRRGMSAIRSTSPYSEDAKSLIAEADQIAAENAQQAAAQKALSLYRAGKGPEALKMIEDGNIEMDDAVIEKITKVADLMDKAQRDLAEKRYEEAQEAWEEVTQIEDDEENWYRRRADRHLRELDDKRPEIAREYQKMAEAAMAKLEYQKARTFFKKARMNDPEGILGKGGLDNLNNMAREQYLKGMVAENKKKYKEAIAAYRKVMELDDPTGEYYLKAHRRVSVLEENVP